MTAAGRVRPEPIRNRLMLALAYDSALRREELCSLRTDDLDPAHRTLRVRAETTKTRRERVVPYSAATGVLLSELPRAPGRRSAGPGARCSCRSRGAITAEPLTLWTWSKVVRRVALAADVPRFSTHTTRHLCLTDLARMGWELHAIATFAGHRPPSRRCAISTCPGRDLAGQLNRSMSAFARATHRHAHREPRGHSVTRPLTAAAVRDDARSRRCRAAAGAVVRPQRPRPAPGAAGAGGRRAAGTGSECVAPQPRPGRPTPDCRALAGIGASGRAARRGPSRAASRR